MVKPSLDLDIAEATPTTFSVDGKGILSWGEQIDLKEGDAVHAGPRRSGILTATAQGEFGLPPLAPGMIKAIKSVDLGSFRAFGPSTPA